jgi:hypothetical protein
MSKLTKSCLWVLVILTCTNYCLVIAKQPTFPESQPHKRHCLIVVNDAENPTLAIGIDRIKSFYKGVIETSDVFPDSSEQHNYKLIIVLGAADSRQELKKAWQKFDGDDGDCFMVKTIKQDPPTIAVTGIGLRGTLYAAYRMAELLETGTELSSINVRLIPKVKSRYAYVAGATHQGRIHRPDLFIKTLQELPRYGFNGILMCPGATAATPIGYHSGLPFSYPANLAITKDGRLDPQPEELQQWKTLLKKYDDYGLETMIYWCCLVPPGYDQKSIVNYYYHGGPEPPDYLEALRQYNYNLAKTFIETFPEIDIILFGPVEGGEWGQTIRLFTGNHHVSEKHVLPAYLDSLSKVCKQYNKKLAFWTHVAGITSSGIRALREALYKYPEILIVEDDYWPNAGWAHMKVFGYLPDDLRMALADRKNSLGMFQNTTDGEYYGGGSMPNAFPEPFADSARQAVQLNFELVIMRFDLHDRTKFGTLFNMAEINPLSASAQLWSPTPSQDELWKSWARRRFGPKAAELILPALRSSGEIIQTGFVYSGLHLAEWSAILARTWYVSDSPASRYNLFGRAGTPITPKNKNDVLQHADYYALQAENRTVSIAEFQARQNAAIHKAKQGIAQIDKARAYLCQEDYDYLHDAFEKVTVILEALKLLGKAAYATHIMMDNFDNVSDPKAAFEKTIDDLKKFADEVHKKYGPDLEYPPLHTNLVNIANHYQQYIHRERKD